MKFTATDLVRKASQVFNEVQRAGWVKIVNKGRPDMVLVTQQELDSLLSQKWEEGFCSGKEQNK